MSAPSLHLVRRTPRPSDRSSERAVLPRLAERTFAAVLLLLLSPVFVFAAVTVALLSGRSPFIAHRRVGQYGVELWMLKIRTMWDKERSPQPWKWVEYVAETLVPLSKSLPDPRVTSKIAAFYRRYSLDELPQLLHVISGRMSLVGPRPITFSEWITYYGDTAEEALSVPPGITGLWQVLGRNRLTYRQRRRLDLFYARHRGPRLDWLILARTPIRVLTGRDAV